LIVHALLIEAFIAGPEPKQLMPALAIGLFGFTAAVLWLLIGVRQHWNMKHLFAAVLASPDDDDPLFVFHQRLTKIRKDYTPEEFGWVRATPIFSTVIPGALALLWTSLLVWLRSAVQKYPSEPVG
jgi:hypothetical protein